MHPDDGGSPQMTVVVFPRSLMVYNYPLLVDGGLSQMTLPTNASCPSATMLPSSSILMSKRGGMYWVYSYLINVYR